MENTEFSLDVLSLQFVVLPAECLKCIEKLAFVFLLSYMLLFCRFHFVVNALFCPAVLMPCSLQVFVEFGIY